MVGAKTQLLIDLGTPEGRATGLRTDSVVQCNHLIKIDQSLIHRAIGQLNAAQMRQIDACLRESLGIP